MVTHNQLDLSTWAMAERICLKMRSEAEGFGLQQDATEIAPQTLQFEWRDDPAGGNSLQGTWRDKNGYRCGMLVFNADGSFYAEHDVARPHPNDQRWFIEAVTAWGRGDTIKSELRLLEAV
jgi:hypothetical protein